MASGEERLEEMLKAVMEEENQRAVQNARNAADEEDMLPEIPEMPMEDFLEMPEIPMEDFPEMPEVPMEDFSEMFSEGMPEMPMEDFPEMPEEKPLSDAMPEMPAADFAEMSGEDELTDEFAEMPDMLPENDSDIFGEDVPAAALPEMPEMPVNDLPEQTEQHFEEALIPPEKEMSVDPLEFLDMSEEEIDKILNEETVSDETFPGAANGEDLSDQSAENDDLSDIQQLLQMSDNHVLVDESADGGAGADREDMQSLSEAISGRGEESQRSPEAEPAEKSGKQKKERKQKKVKEKKTKDSGEKKEGLGKKLALLFFGEDDDEPEEEIKKEKGGKKGKEKSADAGETEEGEGNKKKKKEKKAKPPKKEKEKDKEKDAAKLAKQKLQQEKKAEKAKKKAEKAEKALKEKRAAKKLPKKKVFVWVVLCASIGVGILLINSVGMATIQLTEARNAFENKDFAIAYKLLNGKELSEEDQLIFSQSSAVLHLRHATEAYENHLKLNKPVKALEDLLKGVGKYQNLLQIAEGRMITPELTAEYQAILDILQGQYGLPEAGALEINAIESDYKYSLQLEALVNGEGYQSQAEAEAQQEETAAQFSTLEDLLPEEEEYLNDSGD